MEAGSRLAISRLLCLWVQNSLLWVHSVSLRHLLGLSELSSSPFFFLVGKHLETGGIDLTYWSWWEDGGVEGGEVSLTLGASFSAGTY